jgi:hypothetical protein
MAWQKWREPRELTAVAPASPASGEPRAARITAATFDWVYRLRESSLVMDQLDKQFGDVQAFHRDNQLDEFLDLDAWTLPVDQLCYLNHFCEKGFFTVEREILVRLLENKLTRRTSAAGDGLTATAVPSLVAARLQSVVITHEQRIADLRDAIDLYRRGRDGQITVPDTLTPEQDQNFRALVVQKLAGERHKRDELDRRIAQLQQMLSKPAVSGGR